MKRSPKIVIIDSLQYLRITTAQYKELQQLFPKVLFIFISHAKGSEPKGATAIAVSYTHLDVYKRQMWVNETKPITYKKEGLTMNLKGIDYQYEVYN